MRVYEQFHRIHSIYLHSPCHPYCIQSSHSGDNVTLDQYISTVITGNAPTLTRICTRREIRLTFYTPTRKPRRNVKRFFLLQGLIAVFRK